MASIVRAVGNNGYTIKTGRRSDYTILEGSLERNGKPRIKFADNVAPIVGLVQCQAEKFTYQDWRMLEVKLDNWKGTSLSSTYVGDIGYISAPGSPYIEFSPLFSKDGEITEIADIAKYSGTVFYIDNSIGKISGIWLLAWVEL